MVTLKDLLSVPAAAKYLGVSAQTVRNWTRKGQIPHVVLPSGTPRYRVEDLDEIIRGRSYIKRGAE